ncbi:MAG: tRNA (guanosine(46)-N7)-methyltransferase TrmB [Candidatus Endonucleobacter bathymodioli]|uniref:tRNA (guanine-N(7)-)-methyltransferase n=1 Tax=Candidatus Endonucleibacter bathymodioli TaxID=539814 RepID=A0AA90STD8_9GAMM|nr:tRNA (guanosine(46)-N7)-methyltransferase TrmB [Candidatus Endonucleobacter bathymodioli]
MSETTKHYRKIKSFVLRNGRMTTAQQRGWDECWEKWGLKLSNGFLDLEASFGRQGPTILEIGYGMGLSLVEMARNTLDSHFIGIEVHRPGVGSLLNEANNSGLTNIRSYCHDAVEVLNQCIPDNILSRIQIYFPDPWHKKRHHKRRLIQPEFIKLLSAKLVTGGTIHLATDWENYADQMMEVMSAAEGFKNQAGEHAFSERPTYRPLTKFEKRGQRLGHNVLDLLFEKQLER